MTTSDSEQPLKLAPSRTAAKLSAEALDFAPGLLSIQETPPARLPRAVLYTVSLLFALALVWSYVGKLDIVARASGELIPKDYVQIVQPSAAGIVQQILVRQGDHVKAGQVLMRMDATSADADLKTVNTELLLKTLELQRIRAELADRPLRISRSTPASVREKVQAQYRAHRQTYQANLAAATQALSKAERDAASAGRVLRELQQVVPLLKQQADSYAQMGRGGYVARVLVEKKEREYLEKAGNLSAQKQTVQGLRAAVSEAREQVREVRGKYRSNLENERVQALAQYRKLSDDAIKQHHKAALLELRAPVSGVVKSLATHTLGTVVSPGTVLLSLVPLHEPLVARVMIKNRDVGFVSQNQTATVKLAAYPFAQYGTVAGRVIDIEPDATTAKQGTRSGRGSTGKGVSPLVYTALVALKHQVLRTQGQSYRLVSGMQVTVDIHLGRRTVLDYLLSPIKKTLWDSGHER